MTRLLLTRVPFFRELIVSSFSCGACGWADAEIQAAGSIQERGVRYALAVASRQVSGAPVPRRASSCRERSAEPRAVTAVTVAWR